WINRELVGGISSRRARWKRQGLPSSRRNPCDHSPYSSDPGVTRQAEWTMSELPGAAPATDHDEGSPRVVISGLNRTAFDLAVYASQGWSPTHHARLASGCWSGSTGRDWLPAGFHLKGFKLPTILLSRAFLARGQTLFLVSKPARKSRVGKGRPASSNELRVSPSPSKIPYGGFSPVRLQMDRQWRPSTRSQGLSAVHMRPMTPSYTPPQFSLPGIRDPRRDYPF